MPWAAGFELEEQGVPWAAGLELEEEAPWAARVVMVKVPLLDSTRPSWSEFDAVAGYDDAISRLHTMTMWYDSSFCTDSRQNIEPHTPYCARSWRRVDFLFCRTSARAATDVWNDEAFVE